MKSAVAIRKKKFIKQKKSTAKSFPVVAIGASAGGLEAVTVLLKNLPANTGMAYIYVQHLSPDHKSFLPSILSKVTKMKVQEIDDMELMEPNNVYVIPFNKGIEVTDGHIKLIPRSKGGKAISIDILFSSLAETHKANVIGIVLSGNASDGTIGLKAIKNAGGVTFAQNNSAQISSMPKSAIAAGVVDFVLAPKEIANEITRLSKNGVVGNLKKEQKENTLKDADPDEKTIFEILHKEKGIDFSHYKMATINRRMHLRMLQCNTKTIKEYTKLLLKNPSELDLLYKDLLINVTSFFRDTEAFKYLKTTLLPKLLKSKTVAETLRIWVSACSTGQEAYSIAMQLAELQENKTKKIHVKIFATDTSKLAIEYARIGEYSKSDIKTISKSKLKRFFTKTGNRYRIAKEIREMCTFAPHNILSDPPFYRIDFISCRNLLIYFDSAAQKKALATMHFALNDGKYLMLGKSETVGKSSQLFTQINSRSKIFSRKKNTGIRKVSELLPRFPGTTNLQKELKPSSPKIATIDSVEFDNAIDSTLLSNFMPACVIINKDMKVLQFRGSTSAFLTHPSGGKANLNILKMARPEFAFELRRAIHQVIKTKQPVRKSNIEMNPDLTGTTFQLMSLEVCPLKIDWDEPLLLIVFSLHEKVKKYSSPDSGTKDNLSVKNLRIKKLIEELANARAESDIVIQAQETAYEELQAANEEMVSTEEEFQTLNEELEISNKELVSTSRELQMHNELLLESYIYSEAIIATIHEPMIVIDNNFKVKSVNKAFYKKFLVNKKETIGISLFELGNRQWNIPELRGLLKDILSKNSNLENFEVARAFPGIGQKIMLLNASRINQKSHGKQLILLAIADITEVRGLATELNLKENKVLAERLELEKKILERIGDSEKRYRNLIHSLPIAVYTCDKNGYIQLYNKAASDLWGRKPGIGKELWCGSYKIFNADGSPLQRDSCPMAITLKEEHAVKGEEFIIERPNGEKRYILPNPQPVFGEKGELTGAINALIDITAKKRFENDLLEAMSKAEGATKTAKEAEKAKQQFLSNMSHEIRTPMNAIIGFTDVMLKTKLDEKQLEYLNAIKTAGDTLLVLINDILDLDKVNSGKMTLEQIPFKLSASISVVIHLFETKIQEKNIQFLKEYDTSIPEVLLGDSVRLHQIILNLLSNAVKFTKKGKITISVQMLSEDDEKATIQFAVSDTGIGIPENKLTTIFDSFQQATSETSRLYGGTGLGLAIVSKIVAVKGGTITVKSKVGQGSIFSFILTFKKTKEKLLEEIFEGAGVGAGAGIGAGVGMKVLVVEDIFLNQILMKTVLEDLGFEVDIASNGKMGIEKLSQRDSFGAKNNYDIILMDLQMPIMNGFEATKYIRKKMNSQIPIIAITADVTTVDVEKCKAFGMNDYIAKPINNKLLFSKIFKYVKVSEHMEVNGIREKSDHQKKITSAKASMDKPSFAKVSVAKIINLDYLKEITKNNSGIIEMVEAYLEETPQLINTMKQALHTKNWESLRMAAHAIKPSFTLMGINNEFEKSVKEIQNYATEHCDGYSEESVTDLSDLEVNELLLKIKVVCALACEELKFELLALKGD